MTRNIALGITVFGLYYWQRDGNLPPLYLGDVVAMAVIGLLLVWLQTFKRGGALRDAPHSEDLRQSFAFRLGKSLNRVLRH
jgi:hypothetical protein